MSFAGLNDPKDRADVIAYLKLALNPARLHFFDPDTGARLDHATQVA